MTVTGQESAPIRVGFVNNMPAPAFEATYRQFATLLGAGPSSGVDLECYYLPSVVQDSRPLAAASVPYLPVEALYGDPPPILVITGTEPRLADLAAEPYWPDLAALLKWSEATVPAVLLSCLAAHAALFALDGIRRERLATKQSGVFWHEVDQTHVLAAGLGPVVAFPHSRLNGVPCRALREHGYDPFVSSDGAGWTIASREHHGRLLVLLQGHPEYSRETLLKEYRRDVRRFLAGTNPKHPEIPVNYLDETGLTVLERYRAGCLRGDIPLGEFPYEEAAREIRATWAADSHRFFANWVADARTRSALVAS